MFVTIDADRIKEFLMSHIIYHIFKMILPLFIYFRPPQQFRIHNVHSAFNQIGPSDNGHFYAKLN